MIYGDLDRGRPNDERGFIHKKILGVVSKVSSFIPGPVGGIVSGITGKLATTKQAKAVGTAAKFPELRPTIRTFGPGTGLAPGLPRSFRPPPQLQAGPCDFPMVRDTEGRCRTPTSGEFGGEQFGVGAAVMGRYGAALEPGSQIIDRAICLRGMQLGDDGLCYNKSQITNKQRMWPAGRKPLLSGGDMRAISIAARAGRRLEGATKRLQRLGMMKKPARRALPAHAHARAARDVVSV